MDPSLQCCDVSFFKTWKGFCGCFLFFGGAFLWNSILVAIIAHDSCSNRRVGIHLWKSLHVKSEARKILMTEDLPTWCMWITSPLEGIPGYVLMWTMAHLRDGVPWIPWPAQDLGSFSKQTLSTVNAGSPSCTDLTAIMTSRQSLCPGTPPLPVTYMEMTWLWLPLHRSWPACELSETTLLRWLICKTEHLAKDHPCATNHPSTKPP